MSRGTLVLTVAFLASVLVNAGALVLLSRQVQESTAGSASTQARMRDLEERLLQLDARLCSWRGQAEGELQNATAGLESLASELQDVAARADEALLQVAPLPGDISLLRQATQQLGAEVAGWMTRTDDGLQNATNDLAKVALELKRVDAEFEGWMAFTGHELQNVTAELDGLRVQAENWTADDAALHNALAGLAKADGALKHVEERMDRFDGGLHNTSEAVRLLGLEVLKASSRADEALTEGRSALAGVCFAKAKDHVCPEQSSEQVLFHWSDGSKLDPWCGQKTADTMAGNCTKDDNSDHYVVTFVGCCRSGAGNLWL